MMKFFRKHNKKLLAVFMALLMIVFLGGSALDSLLRPTMDRVVAQTNLGTISYQDQRVAEGQTRILELMGANWKRPVPGTLKPLEIIDWILLTREAEQFGMAVDPATVRSMLERSVDIDDVARRLRVKPGHILRAFARQSAIEQTAMAIRGAVELSEAAVRTAARQALDKVEIEAVVLPAHAFVDDQAEFTEAQIDAQFAAHREAEPGRGLEFGYYVPPMVRVQYTKVDRDAIAAEVGIADLEARARTYFEENRELDAAFRRPQDDDEKKAETPADADLEGPPYEPSFYLTWEEAKDVAFQAIRKQEADGRATRIANWLLQHTGEAWLGAARGTSGYKSAPEDVAKLEYYENIRIPKTIAFPDAVSAAVTDFFSEEHAAEVPGLGAASFHSTTAGRQTLSSFAFKSEALEPVISGNTDFDPADYLALFETCRSSLTDSDGNVYVFRVVEGQAGHVPNSVDEVRDRVTADLRLLKGFEEARVRAESLRSCAEDTDLREAYESDEELADLQSRDPGSGSGFFAPPPFARISSYAAARGEGETATFISRGIGSVPQEVADECFAMADDTERFKVLEIRDRPAVMLVSLVEVNPGHIEDFEGMRDGFIRQASSARSRAAMAEWLDPKNIEARSGFTIVTD